MPSFRKISGHICEFLKSPSGNFNPVTFTYHIAIVLLIFQKLHHFL